MTKRKGLKSDDQPNLKRLRSEITGLAKDESRFRSSDKRVRPKQSRKERRKEDRRLKKLRKLAFSQRKPIPTKKELDREKKEKEAAEKMEAKLKQQKAVKKEKQKRLKRKKKMAEEEKRRDKEMADLYDDRMIKEMEKKLKLNKRKKDTLPKSFMDDGLDYILDVVSGSDKLMDIGMNASDEDSDTEADRLAAYGITGEMSDDDNIDDDDVSEDQSENSGSEGQEDDDKNSDDDESDLENSDEQEIGKTVLPSKEKGEESVKSALKKSKASGIEKQVKFQIDDTTDLVTSKAEGKNKKETKGESGATEEKKGSKRIKLERMHKDLNDEDDDELNLSDFDDNEMNSSGDEDAQKFNTDSDNNSIGDDDDDGDDDIDDDDDDDDDDDKDSNDNNDNRSDSDNESADVDKNALKKKDTVVQNFKEDIYGRLRDEEGNIVKPSSTGAYIPPGKRLMLADNNEKKKLELDRLKKQLKGLVNRASESNIQPISSQIENLYLSHSRADVNETLISLIGDACVISVLTPERLSMELMMLVAILHGNVGSEVGAVFLQHLVQEFDKLYQLQNYGEGKEMDNVVVLLSHLYNFKVIHSVLIFDIVKKLVSSFNERDVELILLVLKTVGFSLRKDDPSGLKVLIQDIQSKVSSQEGAALTDQSRVRFMLDVIMAVRNNNMRKIPNYDPDHLEHLRKLIRNYIRGGHFGDNQLHITLEDLLKAEEHGKWWVVGSAWSGQGPQKQLESSKGQSSVIGGIEVSTKLQELARKQRMNTDLRKNIFFIVMTSEDYIDAFEKLLRLGLKSSQQQEIVLVILDCCLQEKKYNPFYSYLGQKFCEHHRSFQMAFQFSLWDRFKELGQISETNRQNLGKLLTHLFATKALSISIFKVVTFGTLEKPMVRLLKQILSDLLLEYPQPTTEAVFQRIAHLDKLKLLHEGLRLFLHHFILGKRKDDPNITILKERVEIVDKIFSSGKSQMLL